MDGGEPTLSHLVQDECFCALLHDSQHAVMTWDSFLNHPLPAHMSPLSTWEVLEALGHCMGVSLFPQEDGAGLWYRRTSELDALADDIAQRSSPHASLFLALSDSTDRDLLLSLHLREMEGAAQLGGLEFSKDCLETHIRSATTPHSPAERLIANAAAVDADLDAYRDCPFSLTLLSALAARVSAGVDAHELSALSQPNTTSPTENPNYSPNEPRGEKARAQMEHLTAYVTSESGEDLIVLRGILIAGAIRHVCPFGAASALVGSLAARVFFLRNGLPALALVPLSEARARWTTGQLPALLGACTPRELSSTLQRSPTNLTALLTVAARCTCLALDELDQTLIASTSKDSAIRDALQCKPEFNHRQRSIVARALRTPRAEFRIRYHQRKHGISYATARRDLVDLVAEGYLCVEQRGKTFVFLAGERITQLATRF